MKLTSRNRPVIVEEVPFGLYVWEMPNGQWVGDDEGNFLNIASMKGDIRRVQELTDTVREYGVNEGAPKFLSGHRQIDDEEFERQKQRLSFGLVPDELDAPAFADGLLADDR